MARDTDHLAGSFETENAGGLMSGFLAEEDNFDRHALWRLGSWGAASVGAVIVALLANQSSLGLRRDQVASADLARQSQQIQSVGRESQNEARRLASAIDTLNGDRDRLYSRVTVLEQGLDSVTGSIARQNAAAPSASAEPQSPAQNPLPAPVASPVAMTAATTAEKPRADAKPGEPSPATAASLGQATPNPPAVTPAMPLMASKSMMAPPDAAAGKLIEPEAPGKAVAAAPMPELVASAPSADVESDAVQATSTTVAVARTEFAVDVGGANSIGGLRALWRGLLKSNAALAALRPIIAVKERGAGLGMQLRLVAGPLSDAAAAAKICAALIENERTCETTVFDGQHLAMKTDELPASAKSVATRPAAHRRSMAKRAVSDEQSKKPEPSTLSSFFSRR